MKSSLSLLNPKLLAIAASIGLFGLSGAQDADAQSILYICGDQKGFPGVAFDHGLIDYIETKYASGTVTPTLSSETPAGAPSAQGLYDPDDPTVTQSYDFNWAEAEAYAWEDAAAIARRATNTQTTVVPR